MEAVSLAATAATAAFLVSSSELLVDGIDIVGRERGGRGGTVVFGCITGKRCSPNFGISENEMGMVVEFGGTPGVEDGLFCRLFLCSTRPRATYNR